MSIMTSDKQKNINRLRKKQPQATIAELQYIGNQIVQSVTAQFQIPDDKEIEILQTVSAEFENKKEEKLKTNRKNIIVR
jgi:hypothetical protein